MKSGPRGIRQLFCRTHLCVLAFLIAWISPPNLFAAGGDLDTTFEPGTGANGDVRAIAVQPDGKIVIGGAFTTYDPEPAVFQNRIARLNPNGTRDTSFNILGGGANDIVYAIALQSDGKIIIGGAFTAYDGTSRNGIARLHPNGFLDTTFDPGPAPNGGANGDVRAIAIGADGKIIIGGVFTSYNGTGRNHIARLNLDGSLDTTFDPDTGASGSVFALAVQPDGKIIIGGAFSMYASTARGRIARLNPTGSLDFSFDPGTGVPAGDFVFAVAVQLDGRIVIGGLFSSYNGVGRNGIARLNATGSLDTTFDPGTGASSVHTVAVQDDGKVIIGSSFTSYNDIPRNSVARINTDGSVDDSFDPKAGVTAGNFVYAIAVQPDGRILIGGTFDRYNGDTRYGRIARLLPAPGALSFSASANSVDEGAGNAVISLTRSGGTDNSVRAKATITDGTTSPADYLFAPGALDPTFDPGAGATTTSGLPDVRAIAIQPDNKILIGGEFTTYNGVALIRIARLNANGSLDTTFDPGTGASDTVFAIAVQPDGKILIGGQFLTYNGVARSHIARLNTNGSLDTTFDPGTGANGTVLAVAVQLDGKILISGNFASYNGIARNRIARLNSDGSLDMTFDPGTGAEGGVVLVIAQADGKIIIGGTFTTYNGTARSRIARLDANGSLDMAFDPGTGADSTVFAVAVQPNGQLIIGGTFTAYNGTARSRIARLEDNGSLDTTFDPGAGATNATGTADVRTIAIQPDNKILIGGLFSTYNGTAQDNIARLNTNGSLDTTFNPGTGPSNGVDAVAIQADGKIIIGGRFSTYAGISRNGIARAEGDLFVTWPAGDSSEKTIQIPIVDDSAPEPEETVAFDLANLTGGATTGANPTQTLTIIDNDATPTPTPMPTPTASPTPTATPTATPTPSATPSATPGLVANVSTRLPVGTGDNVLIEGFIVLGPNGSTKKIMVRALGPFLTQFGITDALANPTLEIRDGSNVVVATNNDWRTTEVGGIITGNQAAEIETSGLAPTNDLESAIIANLAPGNYTAIVRGLNNTVGTGIVDAYDMSAASPARLANVATRGLIQPGDQLMIAGFIIQQGEVRAVIRAIGPSLSVFGITNALPDTTLQLRDVNGAIVRENDDWESDQKAELEATGLQPGDSREAALVATLPPGQYTAQVRGKPETTGIGVVEVYFLQ